MNVMAEDVIPGGFADGEMLSGTVIGPAPAA
jgi:hypothetical protein